MNFNTLKTRVTMYLDRADINTATNPYAGYWINDVRLELATIHKWPHLWTEAYLTTSAGSSDYALPTDFLDHLTIRIGDKNLHGYFERDYDKQILDDRDNPRAPGEPEGYYFKGHTIRLRPQPNGAYTMYLVYYARPSDFSEDSDNDHWTNNYPYVLIHGAVALGATFLDDEKKLKIHMALFERALERCLKKEKAKMYQDVKVQVRTWKDYGTAQWRRMLVPQDPGSA